MRADTALPTDRLVAELQRSVTIEHRGRVVAALGTTIRVTGIEARIGQGCELFEPSTGISVLAEVVGLAGDAAILTPIGDLRGLSAGAEVIVRETEATIRFGDALLGRVLDGRGQPIDDGPPLPRDLAERPLYALAPAPMQRATIDAPLATGIRVIDAMLTLGIGQRLGVFASAGGASRP